MHHDLTLTGHGVRLVPLAPEHAAPLVAFVDDRVWRGMSSPTPRDEAAMAAQVHAALEDPARVAFAVLDHATGEVLGSSSLYEINRAMGRLELGHTFYAPRVWGTHVNPATKLALMTLAFEQWGMHRVAFRVDTRNARSLAAVRRLGARDEGVLRGHRVAADGSRGDSAYLAVLADEWPAARMRLLTRLGETVGEPDAGARDLTDDERSSVVLIGGRSGVGKTTVAHALHALLTRADVPHAVIEGDYLDLAHPAPHAHRLAERNLAAVWSAYRELGYRRLVYTNTVSPQYADDLAAAMGDRPHVTAVLLTASDEDAHARLAQREHGAELAAHVGRSTRAAVALEQGCPPAVHRVDTTGRTPDELAHQIATLAHWLP